LAYLVDSDRLIDFLEDKPEATSLLRPLFDEGVSISAITYMEAFEGIARLERSAGESHAMQAMLDATPLIPVSQSIARRCAHLRLALRQRGRGVTRRSLDLLIAATALEYDLTLVSRNRADYEDIPDLKIYDAPP
jgi:predicted nucleic acid-binding protein